MAKKTNKKSKLDIHKVRKGNVQEKEHSPGEFDFDEELVVFLKGEIVKKEIKNNQDGTVDLILYFKAIDYEIKKKIFIIHGLMKRV